MTPPGPKVALEHHLGNGIFASFDGYRIRLHYADRRRVSEIYLDPPTLEAFKAYLKLLDAEDDDEDDQ